MIIDTKQALTWDQFASELHLQNNCEITIQNKAHYKGQMKQQTFQCDYTEIYIVLFDFVFSYMAHKHNC